MRLIVRENSDGLSILNGDVISTNFDGEAGRLVLREAVHAHGAAASVLVFVPAAAATSQLARIGPASGLLQRPRCERGPDFYCSA